MWGRLHLPEITDKYKKRIELSIDSEIMKNLSQQDNNDDLNAQKIQMDEMEIETIEFSRRNLWTQEYFSSMTQNDIAAIAAVDYAIRQRKPTCGLAMEF